MVSFSVVIPTRNRHEFLKTAIESVLRQTHPALEIIVVDDGEGAAEAIGALSPSIRVLDNHQSGPVPARISGVEAARGDCIAFLDDDDWWTDGTYLAQASDAFIAGADFCFGDGAMVFADGRPEVPFAFDADAQSLTRDNTILISSASYRRSLHASLGTFDETLPFYWDWDWYLRVARSGARFHRIARPVTAIRIHRQNMSGDSLEQQRRANLSALERKHGLAPIPLKNHLNLVSDQPPERT